ncbi:unnamed protein product [Pleuronectes platessa]|uniref:Uncharacterized protein n=1 Tax=Pleuronectes platessa TaxID=8262 RepID=A0A9N7YGD6_PLEPL|nr:unnamed protein product [Pleuronectes platessa]
MGPVLRSEFLGLSGPRTLVIYSISRVGYRELVPIWHRFQYNRYLPGPKCNADFGASFRCLSQLKTEVFGSPTSSNFQSFLHWKGRFPSGPRMSRVRLPVDKLLSPRCPCYTCVRASVQVWEDLLERPLPGAG